MSDSSPNQNQSEKSKIENQTKDDLNTFKQELSASSNEQDIYEKMFESENIDLMEVFSKNPELLTEEEKAILLRRVQTHEAVQTLKDAGLITQEEVVEFYKEGTIPAPPEYKQDSNEKTSDELTKDLAVQAGTELLKREAGEAIWKQMVTFSPMAQAASTSLSNNAIFASLGNAYTGIAALTLMKKGFDIIGAHNKEVQERQEQELTQDYQNRNTGLEYESPQYNP